MKLKNKNDENVYNLGYLKSAKTKRIAFHSTRLAKTKGGVDLLSISGQFQKHQLLTS
jgi:hypothetical protein